MQNDDEPNLLKVLDETEAFRRQRQAELNSVGWPREVLEGTYGKVYSGRELRLEFEVIGFFAPLVVVKSKPMGHWALLSSSILRDGTSTIRGTTNERLHPDF